LLSGQKREPDTLNRRSWHYIWAGLGLNRGNNNHNHIGNVVDSLGAKRLRRWPNNRPRWLLYRSKTHKIKMAIIPNISERLDIVFVEGDTVAHTFIFKDQDGAPLEIDGWDWELIIKPCNGVGQLAEVGDGVEIDFPETNQLSFRVDGVVSGDADFDGARYFLSATVDGIKRTYLVGVFTFQKLF
jgi:hypothetical protein